MKVGLGFRVNLGLGFGYWVLVFAPPLIADTTADSIKLGSGLTMIRAAIPRPGFKSTRIRIFQHSGFYLVSRIPNPKPLNPTAPKPSTLNPSAHALHP